MPLRARRDKSKPENIPAPPAAPTAHEDRPAAAPPDIPRATPYLEPYRKAVDAFGPSFEATLWNSREWQDVRFRVMRHMHRFEGRVILDAGCAQGDFASHLREHAVRYSRYIGLEAIPEICDSARRQGHPRSEFHAIDFVADPDAFSRFALDPATRPDIIAFSGSLNTLSEEASLAVLDRAWSACAEALLFNFLGDRHDPAHAPARLSPARRFNTLAMLDWALQRTTRVKFRQDYFAHGHDATIAMLRRRP